MARTRPADEQPNNERVLEDVIPLLGLKEQFIREKLRYFLTARQTQTLSKLFPAQSERREQVLAILAEKGPLNKYQIAHILKIRYSVAHSTCKALENASYIKMLEEKVTGKARIAKVYGLTLLGLSAALSSRDVWTQREITIIETWKHLDSLILGKWTYLATKIPKSELEQILRSSMQSVTEELGIDEEGKRIGEGPMIQDTLRETFFQAISFRLGLFSTDKWIDAVRSDSDLKEWVRTWLEGEAVSLQYDLSNVKKTLRKISFKRKS